jgi:hypothetical protein
MLYYKSLRILKWLFIFYAGLCAANCNNTLTLPGNETNTIVSIGGVVTGLESGETVTLQNNSNDSVIVTGSGSDTDSFEFGAQLAQGESYNVTVTNAPLYKDCVVGGNTGVTGSVDIMTVQVTCSSTYTPGSYVIGGFAGNLEGSGLVLRNNGSDIVTINANGEYSFPLVMTEGTTYNVTIAQQPSYPTQTCSVTGGTGTVPNYDVNSIDVNCVTDSFTVSGTVTGLVPPNKIILQNNLQNDQSVNGSGNFTFPAQLDMTGYDVTILSFTGAVACSISNNTGNIAGAPVTNVLATCTYGITYQVGGTITGLANGATVVLENNGEFLPVTANGSFLFPGLFADLASYNISIETQPTIPKQTCVVTGGDNGTGGGNISGANELTVLVNCTTTKFSVGVTVNGLTGGDSITLQNNGTDNKSVSAGSPSFTFTGQDDLTIYNVSILTPPTGKTCTVSSGLGIVSGTNPSVTVTCGSSPTYTIGGVISGLITGGSGVTLSNGTNTTNFTANGSFSFPTALPDLTNYTVSITSQPTNPGEVCSLLNQTGTINGTNVTTVSVTCTVNTYSVSGTINWNGNTGSVTLQYNGASDLVIDSPLTSFSFPAKNDGSSYNISALSATGGLTCTPGSNTGVINGGPVSNVTINCSNTATYQVGVNVSGYAASTDLMLANNGTDLLGINSNGISNFSTPLNSGAGYTLTVVQQPTNPKQTCSFTGASSGTVSGATVVGVSCSTNTYTIGGAITGLANVEQITLQNNGGNNLVKSGGGSGYDTFQFSVQIADLAAYNVTVLTAPGGKTCNAGANTGNVAGAPVTTVVIGCTDVGTPLYTLGGAVTGLASGNNVILQNNLGDNLSVTANGAFTFATALAETDPYSVTVLTNPTTPDQTCSIVSGGSGNMPAANVISVNVNCITTQYTVGGTIAGMNAGDSIILLNNGSDPKTVSSNTSFTFSPQNDGTNYNVSIQTMPATTVCTVGAGTGTLAGASISPVTVTCSAAGTYAIGGTLSGLMGTSVQLSLNAGLSITTLNADGAYSFPKTLSSGTIYSVVVSANPAGPTQTCTVANPNGSVSGTINNININCVTNTFTIIGSVAGLATSTPGPADTIPVLFGSTAVIVNGDSPSFSSAPINDGSTVSMQIVQSPYGKDCNFTNPAPDATPPVGKWASVTLAGSNISGVSINCTSLTIASVDVTVTGMAGTGLQLANYILIPNSNSVVDYLNFNSNTTQSFMTQPENSGYSIVVTSMPSGEICYTTGSATGAMAAPAVTVSVSVNCVLSGGGSSVALTLDTPDAESIPAFGNNTYEITGLSAAVTYTFAIINIASDVNLYVFTDAGYTTPACSSLNTGVNSETCIATGSTAYYIKVLNITNFASNYTVGVYSPPPGEGTPGGPIVLSLDVAHNGNVSAGGASHYQISGLAGGSVYPFSLTSLTNNADLLVYSLSDFTSLVCSSANSGVNSEGCFSSGFSSYYIKVIDLSGNGANFAVKVSSPIVPATVILGAPYADSLPAGQTKYYQITGLASGSNYLMDLNNLTNNADIYVYSNSVFTTLVCSSTRLNNDTESCLATASTAYYLKVVDISGAGSNYNVYIYLQPASEGASNSAIDISALLPYSGKVGPAGSSYYKVLGLSTGPYEISITGLDNDIDIDIYQTNFNAINLLTGSANGGVLSEYANVSGLTSYFILITDYTGIGGSFVLNVNPVAPTTVNLATPYNGNLGFSNAFFQITGLASGTSYTFNLTNLLADYDLMVYSDSTFTTLQCSSQNVGTASESCNKNGFTAYYIKIINFALTPGSFTLTVN